VEGCSRRSRIKILAKLRGKRLDPRKSVSNSILVLREELVFCDALWNRGSERVRSSQKRADAMAA
jgi:hypothetical protein